MNNNGNNNLPPQQSQVVPAPTNVSIIESVNLQQVQQIMHKIAQFQAVVRSALREGHDYGRIPGVGDKPTLLKPGAEKILMLLGLSSEYELIQQVEDYEKGFFAYTVRCVLSRNGLKITEGVGHANTRERRYTVVKDKSKEPRDPFSLANTVLKMAKKRALVDATLTVASLSDIFTQDLEDIVVEDEAPQSHARQSGNRRNGNGQMKDPDGPATDSQTRAIYSIAKRAGLSDDEVKAILQSQFGVESAKDLTKAQASKAIDMLQNTSVEQLRQLAGTAPAKDQADDLFGGSDPVDIADDLPFE